MTYKLLSPNKEDKIWEVKQEIKIIEEHLRNLKKMLIFLLKDKNEN